MKIISANGGGGTCLNAPISHFGLKHNFKSASLSASAAVVSSHPEVSTRQDPAYVIN